MAGPCIFHKNIVDLQRIFCHFCSPVHYSLRNSGWRRWVISRILSTTPPCSSGPSSTLGSGGELTMGFFFMGFSYGMSRGKLIVWIVCWSLFFSHVGWYGLMATMVIFDGIITIIINYYYYYICIYIIYIYIYMPHMPMNGTMTIQSDWWLVTRHPTDECRNVPSSSRVAPLKWLSAKNRRCWGLRPWCLHLNSLICCGLYYVYIHV